MSQGVFTFGLLGCVALLGGCGSRPTEGANASNATLTTEAPPLTEGTRTALPPNSKQITLSVSGMT